MDIAESVTFNVTFTGVLPVVFVSAIGASAGPACAFVVTRNREGLRNGGDTVADIDGDRGVPGRV